MNTDIIERLIAFEDKHSKDLMTWENNGIHFWPCVRTSIFMGIERRLTENMNNNIENNNNTANKLKLLYRIFKNSIDLSKNPYISMPKTEVIYIHSSITRVLEINGKKFDRVSDYFANENQHLNLTIEDSHLGTHNPPEYISNIKYTDSIFLFSRLKKLFTKNKNQLNNDIKAFASLLKLKLSKQLKDIINLEPVISNALHTIVPFVTMATELHSLIRKTGCNFVSIEDCCYGGYKSLLAMLLKTDGIKVIEFQHGLVSNKHRAYNYGRIPDTYLKYLPDYFLTYGQYWNDVLERLPVKKVVIGNPYLTEQVKVLNDNKKQQSRGKRILIVSPATGIFISITKELRKILPMDYSITYRLHPDEVQFRSQRYSEIDNVPGIEINYEGGICDCICNHDLIVGESSTTLFEAIPFEKTIYIINTRDSRIHIPKNFGLWFNDAKDLANSILNNCKNEILDPSYYLAHDWQKNFNNFFQLH